jgi:hypothetical protein
MTDYSKGKIYKLTCSDPELVYYGSTISPLSHRFSRHKYSFSVGKYCSSAKLFERDYENVKIELIEDYPCNSKKELEAREREHTNGKVCANDNRPSISPEEKLETSRKHSRQQYSTEEGKLKKKEYYQKNREARLAYQNERYRAMKFEKSIIDDKIKTI